MATFKIHLNFNVTLLDSKTKLINFDSFNNFQNYYKRFEIFFHLGISLYLRFRKRQRFSENRTRAPGNLCTSEGVKLRILLVDETRRPTSRIP